MTKPSIADVLNRRNEIRRVSEVIKKGIPIGIPNDLVVQALLILMTAAAANTDPPAIGHEHIAILHDLRTSAWLRTNYQWMEGDAFLLTQIIAYFEDRQQAEGWL